MPLAHELEHGREYPLWVQGGPGTMGGAPTFDFLIQLEDGIPLGFFFIELEDGTGFIELEDGP